MSSQIRWKFVLIGLVILACIFGLIGFPPPTSLAGLKQSIADRIKLGLDLKGGSHLVLQVQVDEAIGQRCDQTVDLLVKTLHEKNVLVGNVGRVDDTHIQVAGVDPSTSGTFHDIVANQFPDWTLSPAAGVQNGYLLTLKPSIIADLRRDTMEQALETITRRINALGLTEPTIAFTGRADNEILVQLPGEGDPTRAKAVIQAGGQLELTLVTDDQTYPSEAAALAAHGGILPPGSTVLPGKNDSPGATAGSQVYLHRVARAHRDGHGFAERDHKPQFELSRPIPSGLCAFHRRRVAFRTVHEGQHRQAHGHRTRSQGADRSGD